MKGFDIKSFLSARDMISNEQLSLLSARDMRRGFISSRSGRGRESADISARDISARDYLRGTICADVSARDYLRGTESADISKGSRNTISMNKYRAFLRGGLVDMGFCLFMAGYFRNTSGRQVLKKGVCIFWG